MTVTASWELDREHEDFRASVRAFVDRHVRPVVDESEEAGRPPAALLKEMGSDGLLGLAVPEQLGGLRAELIGRLADAAHWTRGPQRRHHNISPV